MDSLQEKLRCDASSAYSYIFDFEKRFSQYEKHTWVAKNWPITIFIAILYIVLIHGIQLIMKFRHGFQLRSLLATWNICLAIFSLGGIARMFPELIYIIRKYGFQRSVCDDGYMLGTSVTAFWSWLFVISKILELGDTIFIVFRKQHLLFLHWFHHIAAMLGIWYSYATAHGVGRWVACMNYGVHSIMYFYFCLRALRINIPRRTAVIITALQILQMIAGFSLTLWAFYIHLSGEECKATISNSVICSGIYLANAILFLRFFIKSYLKPSTKKQN